MAGAIALKTGEYGRVIVRIRLNCYALLAVGRKIMVIEFHIPNENDSGLRRRFPDEEVDFYDEADEIELEFYGIVVKKRATPSCPYTPDGEYIPRSRRR